MERKQDKAIFHSWLCLKFKPSAFFGGNIKMIIKHIVCTSNQGSFHWHLF